jgi:hypothetical protein
LALLSKTGGIVVADRVENDCNTRLGKSKNSTYQKFYEVLLSDCQLNDKKRSIYALLTDYKLSLVIFNGIKEFCPSKKYLFLGRCSKTKNFLLRAIDNSLDIQVVRVEHEGKHSFVTYVTYQFMNEKKKELSFNMSDALHEKQLLDVLDLT